MKSRGIYLFGALLTLCANLSVFGQTKPWFYTAESPNAAGLRAGIETPVTLASGKVGATFPLYEVKDKDLSLPLVLGYNSSGVKLDLHPGWVGQGWNLSLDAVTRVINGAPDELYWRDDNVVTLGGNNSWTTVLPTGYAFNTDVNTSPTWNSTARITELAKGGTEAGTYWKDAEPDEFIFSCGGLSGSFFLGPGGEVLVQGRSDIKVEADIIYNIPWGFDPSRPLDPNDGLSFTSVYFGAGFYTFTRSRVARIMGFRITGPDGKVYVFGQFGQSHSPASTFDEMEFTANVHDQFYASEVFTSWYMTKVSSPLTGAEINLTYERGSPIVNLGRSFSFYQMGGTAPRRGFWGWLFGGVSSYVSQAQEEVDGKFIRPTYLKSIETSDTRVEFTTSASTELRYDYEPLVWSLLYRADNYTSDLVTPSLYARPMVGQIIDYIAEPYLRPSLSYIHQRVGEEYIIVRRDGYVEHLDFRRLQWAKLDRIRIRKIGSATHYREITFNYTSSASQRLQLLSLLDSDIGKPYSFTYNSSSSLPGYLSMRIDHWGYFNNTFTLINPTSTASLSGYKATRNSVPSYMHAGMLTRVTFPTQGYKEFVYEPNSYKSFVARNTSTGAFSISAPTSQPTQAAGLRVREIREVAGNGMPQVVTTYEYGDGLLNGDVQYYWPNYQGKLFNGNNYSSDRFVTESMLPTIRHSAGGEIAYSRVTEKKTGLGRTEYDFVSFSDNPDVHGTSIDPQKSPYSPFSSRVFARGQLKEKRVYEEGRTLPILKETNTYRYNPGLLGKSIRAVQSRGLQLFGTNEVNAIEGTSYEHYNYPYQLWKRSTQELDKTSNTYVTVNEEFEFNNSATINDNQLKKHTVTNPATGEATITQYKHTWDFTTGSLGTGYPEAAGITGLFNKRIVDRVISSRVSKKASSSATPQFVSAQVDLYRMVGQNPRLYKKYDLDLSAPVSSFTENFTTSSYQLDPKFSEKLHFNQYDNYGNATDIKVNAAQSQSYLWGNQGKHLVASFSNATVSEIALMNGENANDLWGFTTSSITPVKMQSPVSGSVVNIGSGGPVKSNMDVNKKYVVTYWVQGTTSIVVSPNGGGSVSAHEIVASKDGWTKFRCIVSNTASVYITGGSGASARYVDDVLVYPYDSNIKVYNYNEWGAIINETDHTGEIVYYEYDENRRLRLVRDRKGNVLTDYQYNYRTP